MLEVKTELETDYLTGLYNEKYLEKNYHNYIAEKPNSNLIMIDFERFKLINDKYGHSIGDKCLKLFATILKETFKNSIIVRLHGDEFSILTNYSEIEIELLLLVCDKLIDYAVSSGDIPIKFSYNAGSVQVSNNLELTKEKADFMMYHAKSEHNKYQRFNEEIWNKKIKQRDYLSNIDSHLKNNGFSYTARQLFNKDKEGQDIYLICTKDDKGNSIFCNDKYNILRDTYRIAQLDMYNVNHLINGFDNSSNSDIINIDYKSLISIDAFIDSIKRLSQMPNVNPHNVILSINLCGVESSNYHQVITTIDVLRELGFKICLDKYDGKTCDEIWLNSKVDYIKIDCCCWHEAMINPKLDYYLKSKVQMFTNYKDKSLPIFLCIEKQEEHDYFVTYPTDSILLGGNYYSNEKKLLLEHNNQNLT